MHTNLRTTAYFFCKGGLMLAAYSRLPCHLQRLQGYLSILIRHLNIPQDPFQLKQSHIPLPPAPPPSVSKTETAVTNPVQFLRPGSLRSAIQAFGAQFLLELSDVHERKVDSPVRRYCFQI